MPYWAEPFARASTSGRRGGMDVLKISTVLVTALLLLVADVSSERNSNVGRAGRRTLSRTVSRAKSPTSVTNDPEFLNFVRQLLHETDDPKPKEKKDSEGKQPEGDKTHGRVERERGKEEEPSKKKQDPKDDGHEADKGKGHNSKKRRGPPDGDKTYSPSSALKKALESDDCDKAAEALVDSVDDKDNPDDSDVVAETLVEVAEKKAERVAETLVRAARRQVGATSRILTKMARKALKSGKLKSFALSQAKAFAMATKQQSTEAYADSVSWALVEGGSETREAYAMAFATASADTGEDRAGFSQVTAVVFCKGGDRMEAYAEAMSLAVSKNDMDCTVVTETRAVAYARCGPGEAESWTDSSAVSRLLDDCALPPAEEAKLKGAQG